MKKTNIYCTLLLLLPLFLNAQWSPVTNSTVSPIYRSGKVGIGLSSTPNSILHVGNSSSLDPLLRLQRRTIEGEINDYIWDMDIDHDSGKLTLKSGENPYSLLLSPNEFRFSGNLFKVGTVGNEILKLHTNGLDISGDLLKVGNKEVQNSLGTITSGSNNGSFIAFAGTRSLGGNGFFNSNIGLGKTAIIGDHQGNLNFLTQSPGASLMSVPQNSWMTISPEGLVDVKNNLKSENIEIDQDLVFNNLAGNGSVEVLAVDGEGKVGKRSLPENVWDGDNDNQLLSVSTGGNFLHITGGNTVELPNGSDNLGDHIATENLNMNLNAITNISEVFLNSISFHPGSSNRIQSNQGSGIHILTTGPGVGINMPPSTNEFDLEVEKKVCAEGFTESSDRHIKKNITEIRSPLQKIQALHGVQYKLKRNDREDIGFIAQDLKKVLPELVYGTRDGEYSVRYTGVVPVLVEAMKEQQGIINAQGKLVADLQNRLFKLEQSCLNGRSDKHSLESNKAMPEKDASIGATNLTVIPNPAKNTISVQSPSQEIVTISIFNTYGELVKMESNDPNGGVSIMDLPSGMYILSGSDRKGKLVGSTQFVKK